MAPVLFSAEYSDLKFQHARAGCSRKSGRISPGLGFDLHKENIITIIHGCTFHGLRCHACMSIPGVMLATHSTSLALAGSADGGGGGGGGGRWGESSPCLKSGVVVAEVMQMRRSVKQPWTRPTEGTSEPRFPTRNPPGEDPSAAALRPPQPCSFGRLDNFAFGEATMSCPRVPVLNVLGESGWRREERHLSVVALTWTTGPSD